jgi:hypothetical protein
MGNGEDNKPIEDAAKEIIDKDAKEQTETGRPGKPREDVGHRKGLLIGTAFGALVLVGVGVAVATSGGGGGTSHPTPTTKVTTIPTTTTTTPTTARPLLTGTYTGTITVADDPQGHAPFIGPMPGTLNVFIGRDRTTLVIIVQITGASPFIPLTSTGTYSVDTGTFSATGAGTVTSRNIPVTATFEGTLINGKLTGTLTFTGTPNGPISYHIEVTKTADSGATP